MDGDIAISLFEKEGYQDKIRLLNTLDKAEYDIYSVDGHYFHSTAIWRLPQNTSKNFAFIPIIREW